jgi:hypothetical protein
MLAAKLSLLLETTRAIRQGPRKTRVWEMEYTTPKPVLLTTRALILLVSHQSDFVVPALVPRIQPIPWMMQIDRSWPKSTRGELANFTKSACQ